MKISKSFRKSQIEVITAAVNNTRQVLPFPGLKGIRVRSTKKDSFQGWAEIPEKGKAIIFVNRELKKADLFTVVVHEMTHVSQYLRGDLESTDEGFIWRGKAYCYSDNYWENIDYFKYRSLPWEAEAYSTGEVLTEMMWNNTGG